MVIGIIPARYASTRFPGKPLQLINGMTMIERVYRQAKKATLLEEVIIATDDERIYEEALAFGAKVQMTASHHLTGTDRCQEIANSNSAKAYINIQGDEPFIQPEQIDLLANFFHQTTETIAIATLIKATTDLEMVNSRNTVKVVIDKNQKAIYFSRFQIPFYRNEKSTPSYYKHIGMYGYTKKALLEITQLNPSTLEMAESLEQLRWLENGYPIYTLLTPFETISIDVPEDLDKITQNY